MATTYSKDQSPLHLGKEKANCQVGCQASRCQNYICKCLISASEGRDINLEEEGMNRIHFLIDSNVLFQKVLTIDEDLSKRALEMIDIMILTTLGDDYIDSGMSQKLFLKNAGEGWG